MAGADVYFSHAPAEDRKGKSLRSTTATVSDVIHAHYDALTRSEKRLAESLLGNYPVSGLGSITTIAENLRRFDADGGAHGAEARL